MLAVVVGDVVDGIHMQDTSIVCHRSAVGRDWTVYGRLLTVRGLRCVRVLAYSSNGRQHLHERGEGNQLSGDFRQFRPILLAE